MIPPTGYKKLRRIERPGDIRYLTCSCQHRLPLFKNDRIKEAFVEQLLRARERHRFRLIAWVLMPEHFHLLILPDLPASPVSVVLNAIKSPLSQQVLAHWRAARAPILDRITDTCGTPRFWLPGGGYDRNIHSDGELYEKIRYIHRNPVKRGLVERPIDWPWSSARWYAGDRGGPVPIDPPITHEEEARRAAIRAHADRAYAHWVEQVARDDD